MKTTYHSKIAFCVLALAAMPAVIPAQENRNVSSELTLEREYDPSVQDANKVNTLPAVKEPEIRKMPVDYSPFTAAVEPSRQIGLLPPGSIMTDVPFNKRRGYLNVGAGMHLNIDGDAGYHLLSTEKDQMNIFFSHRSTNGYVKYIQDNVDAKAKARLNDNLGGVNFRHVFDKTVLRLGAGYDRMAFNYYGLPSYLQLQASPLYRNSGANGNTLVLEKDTNQVNQAIKAYAGFGSVADAPIGYLAEVNYTGFRQKYFDVYAGKDGVREHNATAVFDLNAAFGGTNRVGLGIRADYLNCKIPEVTDSPTVQYFSRERFLCTFSPYYKAEGQNWHIKLGVNAALITSEPDHFVASPNIAADVTMGDRTVLYVNAGGGAEMNSYYSLSGRNRYAFSLDYPGTSRTWVDAVAGVKSGIAPGVWLDVFAGYKLTDGDCFFVPDFGWTQFDHVSEVISLDAKHFFAGANLKYAYRKLLEIGLKGVYHNWRVNGNGGWDPERPARDHKAYGRPEMELTAGVLVNPVEKLSLNLEYYLATGRYTTLNWESAQKMKNINEMNLTTSYVINDTFGA
jgi:hypothetical protein